MGGEPLLLNALPLEDNERRQHTAGSRDSLEGGRPFAYPGVYREDLCERRRPDDQRIVSKAYLSANLIEVPCVLQRDLRYVLLVQPKEELLDILARHVVNAFVVNKGGRYNLNLRPTLKETEMPAFSNNTVASRGLN